jgi:hypothetical protein
LFLDEDEKALQTNLKMLLQDKFVDNEHGFGLLQESFHCCGVQLNSADTVQLSFNTPACTPYKDYVSMPHPECGYVVAKQLIGRSWINTIYCGVSLILFLNFIMIAIVLKLAIHIPNSYKNSDTNLKHQENNYMTSIRRRKRSAVEKEEREKKAQTTNCLMIDDLKSVSILRSNKSGNKKINGLQEIEKLELLISF